MQDLAWSLFTNQTESLASDSPHVEVGSAWDGPSIKRSPAGEFSAAEMPPRDFVAGAPEGPIARVPRDRSNDAPLAAWLAFALVGFGVLAEFTIRTSPQGLLAALLAMAAVAIARVAAGRHGDVDTWRKWSRNAAAALGFGASFGLVWRSNTTLRVLDYLTILASVALVSDVWLRASLLSVRRVVRVLVAPVAGFFTALSLCGAWVSRRYRLRFGSPRAGLTESVKRRSALIGRIAAGVVLAVPVVGVLGLLLASADAVFASFLQFPNLDFSGVDTASDSAVRIALFGLLLAAPIVAGTTYRPEKVIDPEVKRAVGRVEALVVFAAVDALFGLFCVAQLVTLSGGAKRVLTTSGLTYAEYARSGFFQLVAVAILTLMVLGALRAAIGEQAASENSVRLLSALTAMLTLAVTFVAMNRMLLYIRAYGLTVDRIVAQAGTITIGCIFVLVTFGILGSRPGRDLRGWTTAGALGVAALAIAVLHIVNPSGWSMRDGLRRFNVVSAASDGIVSDARGSAKIEIDNDSLPVVTEWLRTNPTGSLHDVLRQEICSQNREPRAWYQWEWSNMVADQARREFCDVSW